MSADLEQFLQVVERVSAAAAESGTVADGWAPVESAGLPSLARDTSGEADALQWLSHTVRVAAGTSPALAFVLAARYAADLALGRHDHAAPTFAIVSAPSDAVVVTSPAPDRLVLLDLDDLELVSAPWAGEAARSAPMTGLAAARPVRVGPRPAGDRVAADPSATLAAWDVLAGAALVGIAERAVKITQAYVVDRKQFGVPIGSFSGLRALVAGMSLRAEPVRAQLDLALDGAAPSDSVSALAGRAAVRNCLDAIQAHGGYGYIDEYPVAGLLRDAVSLQARSGGRRLHVARIALRGLGAPVGRRS